MIIIIDVFVHLRTFTCVQIQCQPYKESHSLIIETKHLL